MKVKDLKKFLERMDDELPVSVMNETENPRVQYEYDLKDHAVCVSADGTRSRVILIGREWE